jgi:pimeloyl-ACP methyl ester carboxylesterase
MKEAVMQPQNRTNVRASARAWLNYGLGVIGAMDPHAAAALAAELFIAAPPRRISNPAEKAVLRSAERSDIEFESELLPVYRFGSGPAVLLVHGWGGSSGQLHAFVAPLLARGVSVVAFDAPGHGVATGTWLAIPRFASAILQVAEQLGPFRAVIGHSMGAAAAAYSMSLGLRVDRAVLIGPPASEYDFFRQWFGSLGLADHILPLAKQRVVERVGATFERLRPQPLAGGICQPLLVIHDRDDREVPYADGVDISAAAPNGRLYTTQGLGHRRILRDPRVLQTSVNFVLDLQLRADSSQWSASNPALL